MKDSILLCSHVIEKTKRLIAKVSGRSSGRQFKFLIEVIYIWPNFCPHLLAVYSRERFIKVSSFKCRLNGYHSDVWVVISYMDFVPDPMILITNKPPSKKEDIAQAVYRYSSRWKIEEYFRFKKVEFGFKNFRVKSLDSINNLMFALDIVIMLLAVIVEEGSPYLYGKLLGYGKAIKDSVSIEFYRILSGISTILGTNKRE